MKRYDEMTAGELAALLPELRREYDALAARGLNLDMSRGKMGAEQFDFAKKMLENECLGDDFLSVDGTDCRNYGGLDGIVEIRKIIGDLLCVTPDEVVVGGNSSLAMMFDNIAVNMSHGVAGGSPWQLQQKWHNDEPVKFICPVPGYDRHFAVCDYFHIKMETVDIKTSGENAGPDMDAVEELVKNPMVKGMWCVPVFSNPDGTVYSDETVRRIARLKPAAPDFRVYWDNAYCIHNFRGDMPKIPNIIRECEKAGNADMVWEFMSFSKISYCGAAVAAIVSSKANVAHIKKRLFVQTVGPDKLNQLRHARFFKDADGVRAHMENMKKILRPKFEEVTRTLERELASTGIAEWTNPDGGYFISLTGKNYTAKRTVELCRLAGLRLTEAGATYPHGYDKRDRNIRIAPTYPPLEELKKSMELFCAAAKVAAAEKLVSWGGA